MNYVTYHLHDEDSLLDSCTNYKLYVDKAKELGQVAIAFTNHGNCYNWLEKKMYCDENNIKYIHGVEIYLTKTLEEKVRDNFHTILLAKNHKGFLELNQLVNLSTQDDHKYYKNRLSFDEFLNISDNIIKISACLASPLARLEETDEYYKLLLQKYDYYEIQPHIKSEDQKKYNQRLYKLSKIFNKKLIAATDTHSLNKYKAECRSILQKGKGIEFSNEDEFDLTYKSYNELVNMFEQQKSLPKEIYLEAINNTNIMAESVESFELDFSHKYPKLYNDEEKVFKDLINTKYQYKLANGIIKDDPQYIENIKEEFRVFKKLDMIGFMLFMSELITWCRENNIPVGFGRGSVGGSTIAYITDITDCNPIIWNTVFSRFCNEDREEIGDIDVDFAGKDRQKVYDYIINKFGEDYTAYVLAIGTMVDKGTIDLIGRALGYRLDIVSEIKNLYDLDSEDAKKRYPDLFYYFDGLLNTAISQSMHPAGIVISPISLPDNYGTFWNKGKRILNINMEEVHEVSLVKYDILGLKNIGIIKDTCNIVGINYPLSHEIDWEDKNVWEDMISSPVGIFQFEGKYSFDLLSKYIPTKINDLSLVNASLRPSGASYRDNLIARKINKNPSTLIDNLLQSNGGYLIFQEDTIKFLTDICGFSGSEADNIRRAIGRKQKDRLDKALPQILEGYCKKSDKPRNIAEKEAKAFLQIIEDSSSYQFGYNHSTMYSMIGYTCAYLRYYYPLEFTTAFLNNANNEDDIVSGTQLAKLKGIKIKPIKFRKSGSGYTSNKKENTIYQGLSSIKFVGNDIAEELLILKDNQYNSFLDLLIDLQSLSINTKQIEILIKLNFFAQFGKNQYLLSMYKYFQLLYNKKTIKKEKIPELNINEQIIKINCEKETDKQYNKIDWYNILSETFKTIYNQPLNIKDQLEAELTYQGYISTISPNLDFPVGYVTSLDVRYTPKLKVYMIQSGEELDYKIYKKQYNKLPIFENDLIYISGTQTKNKVKKAGEEIVKGKVKIIWEELDETEEIILNYSKPNYEKFNTYINKLESTNDYQDQRVI